MRSSSDQLSHDIKSLIMSIKAYVQLAGKHINEQRSLEFLKKADGQINKLIKLIQNSKLKIQK